MSSSLTFNFLSLDPPRRESLYSTMFVVVAGCCPHAHGVARPGGARVQGAVQGGREPFARRGRAAQIWVAGVDQLWQEWTSSAHGGRPRSLGSVLASGCGSGPHGPWLVALARARLALERGTGEGCLRGAVVAVEWAVKHALERGCGGRWEQHALERGCGRAVGGDGSSANHG